MACPVSPLQDIISHFTSLIDSSVIHIYARLCCFISFLLQARYLVGKEGEGFKYIMQNFNHERFVLAAMSNRYARVCLEDSIKYARTRKTFGVPLISHQVGDAVNIRQLPKQHLVIA